MAEKGQLWDDSALIIAFDNAIHKFQMMHVMEEKLVSKTEEELPGYEKSNEFCSSISHMNGGDDASNILPSTVENLETANLLQIEENFPVKLRSSTKQESSSGILPSPDENPTVDSGNPVELVVSSESNCFQDKATYSKSLEQYNELLKEYHELEEKRQKVLMQLNQFGSFSDENPLSSSFTAEEHQGTAVQPLYNSVACYCSYGCQNWVFPCDAVPASCSCCTCADKIYSTISEGDCEKKSAREDPGLIRPPMLPAVKAVPSLLPEASIHHNIIATEEKDKVSGIPICQFDKCSESRLDLETVLNAWYSAGFYTGKYLSENSTSETRMPTQDS